MKENKKIIGIINKITSENQGILSGLFLILNFLIWHTRVDIFVSRQYQVFNIGIIVLLVSFAININNFNFKTFIKENMFLMLIFSVTIYNSFDIIIDFNGIEVDMGARSNILLMAAFPHFLMILASFQNIKKRNFVISISLVLLVILGYSIIPILAQHGGLESIFGISINFSDRSMSVLNNPNALGEFAFIGIFITVFLIIISKHTSLKVMLCLTLPIMMYAIILSGSKTSLYTTIAIIPLVLGYFNFFNKKNKNFLLVLLLIGIIGFSYIYLNHYDFIMENIRTGVGLSGRDLIWKNTLTIIDKNGLKGIGYNNFTYVYREYFKITTSPHNMLLGVYAELGLLSFLLTVILFVYMIFRNHNIVVTGKEVKYKSYLIMFNIFYILYLIAGFSEYSYLKVQTMNIFLFAIIGFNNGVINRLRYKDKNKYLYLALLPVVLLVTILFGYLRNKDLSILMMNSILLSIILVWTFNIFENINTCNNEDYLYLKNNIIGN